MEIDAAGLATLPQRDPDDRYQVPTTISHRQLGWMMSRTIKVLLSSCTNISRKMQNTTIPSPHLPLDDEGR